MQYYYSQDMKLIKSQCFFHFRKSSVILVRMRKTLPQLKLKPVKRFYKWYKVYKTILHKKKKGFF